MSLTPLRMKMMKKLNKKSFLIILIIIDILIISLIIFYLTQLKPFKKIRMEQKKTKTQEEIKKGIIQSITAPRKKLPPLSKTVNEIKSLTAPQKSQKKEKIKPLSEDEIKSLTAPNK